MKILDFKSITRDYRFDLEGIHWSRIYEYPLVLDLLDKYGATPDSKIHNTCWGFEGVHIWFKEKLEANYDNVINSDIKPSIQPNTCIYNLLDDPKEEWVEEFDFVLNVSTLEEVKNGDHIEIFNKSLSMVKPGGYFIITFDYPGLQLDKFEKYFNQTFKFSENDITGANSEAVNNGYSHLKCGYIVIQK